MQWLLRLAQTIVFAPMGYAFVRFLIAVGVPLDGWASAAGQAFLGIPSVNGEAVAWGVGLILTLGMFWLDGRYLLIERWFYAGRPIRLNEEAVMRFVDRLQVGQELIGASAQPPNDWVRTVVEWNHSVESLVRAELPPKEWVGYTTVCASPAIGQPYGVAHGFLQGRYNKLRAMTMRLLPPAFDRR